MIKPDAVEDGYIGLIIDKIINSGFKFKFLKMNTLSIKEAQKFYEIHKDRPFFNELVSFITRGPIIVAVIEKKNAVQEFRKLIGSTNPAEAKEGTIRKIYAKSVGENAIHGSDSDENAILESKFHFGNLDFFNEL
jgi:nucleoside-diphosphate kinase|tara:strand:- start:425 stop:829 length:405 start_codon:yes stop_codon:yes gene_type:complete